MTEPTPAEAAERDGDEYVPCPRHGTRCFHQMSRPFDCVADVQPGAVALMSPQDAAAYPDARKFGVSIEACADVPEGHVWIRTRDSVEA